MLYFLFSVVIFDAFLALFMFTLIQFFVDFTFNSRATYGLKTISFFEQNSPTLLPLKNVFL